LICSVPIILVDFDDFSQETVVHETAHSLMRYFMLDKNHVKTVNLIIDIFISLKDLSVILPKDIEIAATEYVDPVHWKSPSAKPEHPSDSFDEFFASAVEGYLTNKKGLINSAGFFIKHTDSKNKKKFRDATSRLLTVLDCIFNNKKLKNLKINTSQNVIDNEINKNLSVPNLKDTLDVHPRLVRLFTPARR
jgi:hypothetical protein